MTAHIFGAVNLQPVEFFLRFFDDTAVPDFEHFGIIDVDVPDAVIKIVAGRIHAMFGKTIVGKRIHVRFG